MGKRLTRQTKICAQHRLFTDVGKSQAAVYVSRVVLQS